MNTRTKFIFFLLGAVAGVILTFLFLFIYGSHQKSKELVTDDNIVLFDEPTQTIPCDVLSIFYVFQNGNALARIENEGSYDSVIVFLFANEDKSFYNDQKIIIHKDKCLKQIGTYRYEILNTITKTVPIVNIYDR